ncbi:MAG: U32 family peptidase, partial [Candidatus Omnitrophica bacterium]|nr:U32 family peptidase [Candidatus Omnitrophota bacterium]
MKDKNIKKPELVSPAGDWCSLRSAVNAGADAVYFGVGELNMRKGACNFDSLELKKIMDFLHSRGKKGYLALNVLIYDGEIGKVKKIIEKGRSAEVDAVILWD